MRREEIISILISALKDNDLILSSSAKIYVFGSLLSKTHSISDVDIAVVLEPNVDPRNIKKILDPIGRYFPLDVIYMSCVEEEEFNFLVGQRAIDVFDKG